MLTWTQRSDEREISKELAVREIYIECLEKMLERLKEKENLQNKDWEPDFIYPLPTIIFTEIIFNEEKNKICIWMTAYPDRNEFLEMIDRENKRRKK